jgi:hypothetical protein
MARRYVWLTAAVAAVLGLGSLATVATGKPTGDPGAFRLSAATDRSVYQHGDRVALAGKACSKSWWWFKEGVGGGGGVHVSWRVLDDAGEVVADSSHRVRTDELRLQIWWPRACRGWDDKWDLRYGNPQQQTSPRFTGSAVRGEPVPLGTYRVEVEWRVGQWAQPQMSRSSRSSATHTQITEDFQVTGRG